MTDDILSSLWNVFPLQAGCSHPELFSWVENLELERTSERNYPRGAQAQSHH